MNISLPGGLEKYVRDRVKAGQYGNASEVVRDGLRLLQAREKELDWLRQEIQLGLDDEAAGRVTTFDADAFKKRMRRRLRTKTRKKLV